MITVLGASGFVGSNLVTSLIARGIEFDAPDRNDELAYKDLGHVVYCIGMTADFRSKPFETIEAHVCKLKHVLEKCRFQSFTYLSSTRLYLKVQPLNRHLKEYDDIVLNVNDAFDLFAASKITGELLALNCGRDNIKVVRLSNVFGTDFNSENFITAIVKDALTKNRVELHTTPDSAKDYISIQDVTQALILLGQHNSSGVYNLAYGHNTNNNEILSELKRLTGAEIRYSGDAKKIIFQEIDNMKLVEELGFRPSKSIIEGLAEIVNDFSSKINSNESLSGKN